MIWFDEFSVENNIDNPFVSSINVTSKVSTNWSTETGNQIEFVHPPFENLEVKMGSSIIDATPIKMVENKEIPASKLDISKVVSQNNFSNLALNTISQQMDRIENVLNKPGVLESRLDKKKEILNSSFSSSFLESSSIQRPCYSFSVLSDENCKQIRLGNNNNALLSELIDKFNKLEMKKILY